MKLRFPRDVYEIYITVMSRVLLSLSILSRISLIDGKQNIAFYKIYAKMGFIHLVGHLYFRVQGPEVWSFRDYFATIYRSMEISKCRNL